MGSRDGDLLVLVDLNGNVVDVAETGASHTFALFIIKN
jgi:hypothetical protein